MSAKKGTSQDHHEGTTLCQQLQANGMSQMGNGGWRYSAPRGGHDATVIATALSLYGYEHSGRLLLDFV